MAIPLLYSPCSLELLCAIFNNFYEAEEISTLEGQHFQIFLVKYSFQYNFSLAAFQPADWVQMAIPLRHPPDSLQTALCHFQ